MVARAGLPLEVDFLFFISQVFSMNLCCVISNFCSLSSAGS